MGLRLLARIQDIAEKKSREREEAERAAARQEQQRRAREEEIAHEERRSYARTKGEQQALLEVHSEAQQMELEHATRMLAVRQRAEEIAHDGAVRRREDMESWLGAISATVGRFRKEKP